MADGWAERIEQTEVPLLWLAGGAVGLYLLDLAGLFTGHLGLSSEARGG